jgi:peptidoglycan hydrolase-like protein with peptidoglycan-binding domain
MSNSSMVSYTKLSPNNSGTRTHAIDRVTIHCTAGRCSVEALGSLFARSSTQASSNYGIGEDGRVGLYVPESKRSWCSSSKENDQRAVTIECSSDSTAPYAVNDTVYAAMLDLVEDICRRNGKKKLLWLADKEKTVAYNPEPDEMLMSVHRWWANKSCPGDYLFSRMGEIAEEVTRRLKNECEVTVPVLRRGDKCGFVKTAQILLNKYISSGLTEDGSFGAQTEKQVKRYQKIVGYPETGIMDAKTWWHLLK